MHEGPESHGSIRMEKVPGGGCGGGGCCWPSWRNTDCDGEFVADDDLDRGEKVRRKVESPLRCLTVRDMAKLLILLSRSPRAGKLSAMVHPGGGRPHSLGTECFYR